jgi:hypothetical protein
MRVIYESGGSFQQAIVEETDLLRPGGKAEI